jgi:O-antigen/teichoic acid export membrane protein
VVLVLFAPEILALWLKGDFAARSTGVLRILAISFALNALSYVPFSAVQGLGRPDLKAKLDLAEVHFCVILSCILIPRYGVAGAALAKLGVTIIDTVGLFWMAGRLGAFSPLGVAWRGVRGAVIVASGYGVVSLMTPLLFELSIRGKLGIALVVGIGYGLLVWRYVLDLKDRSYLRQIRPWALRPKIAAES